MHLNIGFAYNEAEWMNIINQNIWQLLWVSLDNPLWYIREIIILAIASPIIYLLIRDKKLGGLLTSLLSIWACFYYTPWLRSSHITLFFIWGAYFGLHKMNILKLCTRISYLSYPLGLLYPYMRIFAEGESWTKPLLLPGLALSVIMLFNIARIIHSKWQYISKWLSERNNAIFFMYAAHWILYINIIRGSLYSLLPWDNDIEKIVALSLTCTIVPMATYYSYKLLAYLFPTLTQWLCGGRG